MGLRYKLENKTMEMLCCESSKRVRDILRKIRRLLTKIIRTIYDLEEPMGKEQSRHDRPIVRDGNRALHRRDLPRGKLRD